MGTIGLGPAPLQTLHLPVPLHTAEQESPGFQLYTRVEGDFGAACTRVVVSYIILRNHHPHLEPVEVVL